MRIKSAKKLFINNQRPYLWSSQSIPVGDQRIRLQATKGNKSSYCCSFRYETSERCQIYGRSLRREVGNYRQQQTLQPRGMSPVDYSQGGLPLWSARSAPYRQLPIEMKRMG
ncbi:hypothetical protein HNY73_010621 [Argiope bruennichi]|uniref:Uncharacterized protein n=1 Tax=Argiope bruennichi TaxID=94029 RepID=A0A8T0F1L9_ARGBR|nr:hypothetical protein HNY73_010621 [Argiope bruennichi]